MRGLSTILEQTSAVGFPHQNKDKLHISVCPQTLSIRGTAQQHVDLSPLGFFCGATKRPSVGLFRSN